MSMIYILSNIECLVYVYGVNKLFYILVNNINWILLTTIIELNINSILIAYTQHDHF